MSVRKRRNARTLGYSVDVLDEAGGEVYFAVTPDGRVRMDTWDGKSRLLALADLQEVFGAVDVNGVRKVVEVTEFLARSTAWRSVETYQNTLRSIAQDLREALGEDPETEIDLPREVGSAVIAERRVEPGGHWEFRKFSDGAWRSEYASRPTDEKLLEDFKVIRVL